MSPSAPYITFKPHLTQIALTKRESSSSFWFRDVSEHITAIPGARLSTTSKVAPADARIRGKKLK